MFWTQQMPAGNYVWLQSEQWTIKVLKNASMIWTKQVELWTSKVSIRLPPWSEQSKCLLETMCDRKMNSRPLK